MVVVEEEEEFEDDVIDVFVFNAVVLILFINVEFGTNENDNDDDDDDDEEEEEDEDDDDATLYAPIILEGVDGVDDVVLLLPQLFPQSNEETPPNRYELVTSVTELEAVFVNTKPFPLIIVRFGPVHFTDRFINLH